MGLKWKNLLYFWKSFTQKFLQRRKSYEITMTCPQSDAKLEPIANWPLAFSRAFFSMQSFLLPDWLIVINLVMVFPLLNQMHSIRESILTYFLSPTGLFWVVNFRCHRKVIHGVQIFIVLLVTEIIKQQHSCQTVQSFTP